MRRRAFTGPYSDDCRRHLSSAPGWPRPSGASRPLAWPHGPRRGTARGRCTAGPRLPVEDLIRKQTSETAALVGLLDRGVLEPGYKADVNVIGFDRLRLHAPTIVNELPARGRRLMQRADGYVATIVSGAIAFRYGDPTGAYPGRLVGGARPAPV